MKVSKITFVQLIWLLQEYNIVVYDPKLHGPGVAFRFGEGLNGGISIQGNLSWHKKVYILLHEMGHLLKIVGYTISLRSKSGTEQEANDFACKFIELNEIGFIHEYEELYNTYHGKNIYKYGKKKELQSKRTRSSKKVKSPKPAIKKRS